MFYGLTYSLIYSKNEKVIYSINPEMFFILDLHITQTTENNNLSLEKCIENYISEEELIGENAWFNEKKNKKENVIKKMNFWSLPDILIISFKRFLTEQKILINFPLVNLNLNKYTKINDNNIYDLYAIVNHFGNVNGGHYNAFIKKNKNWIIFDDNNIKLIDENNIITPYAYCLFYVKQSYDKH
jgi:ubiquitin carboxyl-terminal hydrolase 4/11/15